MNELGEGQEEEKRERKKVRSISHPTNVQMITVSQQPVKLMSLSHTLFVTSSIPRQEENGGASDLHPLGLLRVHALAIEVESIGWVQSCHTPRQHHPLSSGTNGNEKSAFFTGQIRLK